jgi:hypothetical protein
MIAWPDGVNKKILRSSSWNLPLGVISDQMRSGKSKTRAGLVKSPMSLSVTMNMKLEEYLVFRNWFNNALRRGVFSFAFPQIDNNTGTIKEYRFAPDANISIKNPSGDIIELSMQWEEL